jgi:hypothetical protein
MVNFIKPYLVLIMGFTLSCSKTNSLEFGKSQMKDLEKVEGSPLEVQTAPDLKSKIYTYKDNLKYQIRNNEVVARFRQPSNAEEKYLVFWQNRFKNCPYKIIQHQFSEIELRCEKKGVSVFYTSEDHLISRIVEYEKK